MYSASTVIREIAICKELRQNIGQLAYMMTIPVRDMAFSASLASGFDQSPANYAYT